MGRESLVVNKCHSDWILIFLSEGTEVSFENFAKKSKDTSAKLGMIFSIDK